MPQAYHATLQGPASRSFILAPMHPATNTRKNFAVITCEHGGRAVPNAYAALFAGQQAVLESHRGWDPGALTLGQQIADRLGVPLHAATTTRLLVELNRSIGHPQLFSEFTRDLPPTQRQRILQHHYRPHRDAVEAAIAGHIAAGYRVIHIASHSFTPVMNGLVRHADVAWLYDPRRGAEKAFVAAWLKGFSQHAPALRLRRNYPYRGRDDGLTALLRKRFSNETYVGVELEVNQRFVQQGGDSWAALRTAMADSLALTL